MLTDKERLWLERRILKHTCETCWWEQEVLPLLKGDSNGVLAARGKFYERCKHCITSEGKPDWLYAKSFKWIDKTRGHSEPVMNCGSRQIAVSSIDYKDAAEFEARVCLLVGLSRTPNDCNICPDRNNYETCMADFKRRMGWPCDSAQAAAWFNHKMARLAVEEEMDNVD